MTTEATAVRRRACQHVRGRCSASIGFLRYHVDLLLREARDLLALEEDYNRLQGIYVGLLSLVGSGVSHLLARDSLDVASDMLGSWLRAEDATSAEMKKIKLVSRSSRRVLVPLLAKKVQHIADLVVRAVTETKPHQQCKKKAKSLHEQVTALSQRLLEGPTTLQYLLYLTRAVPLLRKFQKQLEELKVPGDPGPNTESLEQENKKDGPDVHCGGPLWTKLTAEVCRHCCHPEELAAMLEGWDGPADRFPDGPDAKRKASAADSPPQNPLIGMLEDELQPIKIPKLDPSIFKPLPD